MDTVLLCPHQTWAHLHLHVVVHLDGPERKVRMSLWEDDGSSSPAPTSTQPHVNLPEVAEATIRASVPFCATPCAEASQCGRG